ncbi:MAG: hypothetical protein ACKO96_46010, partial [Flammeovirgaceae bacterium]
GGGAPDEQSGSRISTTRTASRLHASFEATCARRSKVDPLQRMMEQSSGIGEDPNRMVGDELVPYLGLTSRIMVASQRVTAMQTQLVTEDWRELMTDAEAVNLWKLEIEQNKQNVTITFTNCVRIRTISNLHIKRLSLCVTILQ